MGDIPVVQNHHQDGPAFQNNQTFDSDPVQEETQTQPFNPPPPVPDDLVNPLGWNFKPNDESMVNILRKKVAGEPVNLDKTIVVEGGFYSKPPEQLFANKPYSYKNKYLVMVDREFKDKGKFRFNRQLPVSTPGSWEPKGKLTSVLDSATGRRIGTRSSYRFYNGSERAGNKTPSSWKMVEYVSTGLIASNMALCCVYKSETKAEKLTRKNKKHLDKSVFDAKVKEDTARLRSEKAAKAAEKAKGAYLCEKLRVKFRRFRAAGGGAGSVNDENDVAQEMIASDSLRPEDEDNGANEDEDCGRVTDVQYGEDNGANEDEDCGRVTDVQYGEFGSISIQLS